MAGIIHDRVLAAQLKNSLAEFFKYFWTSATPDTLSFNWHIAYIAAQLQQMFFDYLKDRKRYEVYQKKVDNLSNKDASPFVRTARNKIINVPPRSSKSLLCSVIFPLWCWLHDPTLKFLCISYSETLVLEHAENTLKIMESERFQALFRHLFTFGSVKSKSNITIKSKERTEGSRKGISMYGTVTGLGGQIMIVDDPISAADGESTIGTMRNECNKRWKGVLSTRGDSGLLFLKIVIMQRLHSDDLTGHILDSKTESTEFDYICLPAEVNSAQEVHPHHLYKNYKDGLLWPSRLPRKHLDKLREDMQHSYYGQMLQNPTDPDNQMVKAEWLRLIDTIPDEESGRHCNYIFLDPAYTKEKKNNPSGILVCTTADDEAGRKSLYIIKAYREWLEFDDLIDRMNKLAFQYKLNDTPPILYVEPKASGKSIVQSLKRLGKGYDVREITSNVNKDKSEKLSSKIPYIKNGYVYLLREEWNTMLVTELTHFPYAKYDDLVDCVSYAIELLLAEGRLEISSLSMQPHDTIEKEIKENVNNTKVQLTQPSPPPTSHGTLLHQAVNKLINKPEEDDY